MKGLRAVLIALLAAAVVVACLMLAVSSSAQNHSGLINTENMLLAAQDNFDGPAGSLPSAHVWGYDVGGGGWGNDEKQVYTDDPRNVRLNGSGQLVIEARQSWGQYSSARIVTRGKVSVDYGLLEVRAKLPEGQGIHPAIWLLGDNIDVVGWPACGEIDVIEVVNSGTEYHNGLHGPVHADPTHEWKLSADGTAAANLSADYHVYQVLRRPDFVAIAIDGYVVGGYEKKDLPAGADWVFNGPMYLLLNVAVGGRWPGPVSEETAFPAAMLVDWVRYWK